MLGFVQEGIGALIAYLPADVACNTIRDFLSVLEPQARNMNPPSYAAPTQRGNAVPEQPMIVQTQ